jgi:hypothetical protein
MTTVDGLTAERLERSLARLRGLMVGEPDGGADLQPAIELVADELSLRRRADAALAAIRHRDPLRAR